MATTAPISATHAPFPSTSAERFVFAQAYETLINVDCEGHAYAGLARSWTTDASKTRVTLVLRDGAHFWNGEPLGANDILAAWRATGAASPDSGQFARRIADATTIVDDRTLIVSLPDTQWLVLAHPSLAISRAAAGAWPMGSGPYRVGESAADAAPGRLVLVSQIAQTTLRLAMRSGPDPRDAIDAGADLLIAADLATVSYASNRSELETIALPWSRGYALAIPSHSPTAITDLLAVDSVAVFRTSLARDAVRAEARAADPSDWWTSTQGCGSTRPAAALPGAPRLRRIVYRSDGHVARELAARLVAVGKRATAAPLTPPEFARALSAGNELGYIVELSRVSLAPCHDLAALLSSVPWLGESIVANGALVPLVDTRERAIVKRGRISATIDWDGTLRMSGAAAWGTRP